MGSKGLEGFRNVVEGIRMVVVGFSNGVEPRWGRAIEEVIGNYQGESSPSARQRARSRSKIILPLERAMGGWVGFFSEKESPTPHHRTGQGVAWNSCKWACGLLNVF